MDNSEKPTHKGYINLDFEMTKRKNRSKRMHCQGVFFPLPGLLLVPLAGNDNVTVQPCVSLLKLTCGHWLEAFLLLSIPVSR